MNVSEHHFTYRWKIEAKPEGGFIAHSDNPADSIEAATREEIEAQMREKLAALLGPEVAAKLDLNHPGEHVATHLEKNFSLSVNKPGQSTPLFAASARADGTNSTPIDGSSSGSLLSSSWKGLVLLAIALLVWLLLRRS